MSDDTPFPTYKSVRFIKHRYRKVWRALIAEHKKHGGIYYGLWTLQLLGAGYVQDRFTVADVDVEITMRRRMKYDEVMYYGTLTVRDWTIIWGDGNRVGFEGNREQFEKDAVLFALALEC
jgi:hypothetical protein